MVAARSSPDEQCVTAAVAAQITRYRTFGAPPDVVAVTTHCILDWLGVAIAGVDERAAAILRAVVLETASTGPAQVIGTKLRTSARDAALLNATAGHALDFDDVSVAMVGHPSAPVVPAALAVAERGDVSGAVAVAAVLAGIETACRIGAAVAPSHYARGFHVTATVGSFAAAAACGVVLDLAATAMVDALAIAGTQAAGLKSQFGTMDKPLHAGHAASTGVLAADLAARGFSGSRDILAEPQGFADTQADELRAVAAIAEVGRPWHIRDIQFKKHAACYLTHPTIDGLLALTEPLGTSVSDIESIVLHLPPGHLRVCGIAEPATANEVKFSVQFIAALAVVHREVSDHTIGRTVAGDPLVATLARRVAVEEVPPAPGTQGSAQVMMTDGGVVSIELHNDPTPTTAVQWQAQQEALLTKFHALVVPVFGHAASEQIAASVLSLPRARSIRELTGLLAGTRR